MPPARYPRARARRRLRLALAGVALAVVVAVVLVVTLGGSSLPGAPPAGPYHHYTYELFALDTKLSLGPDATQADVMKAIDGHVLAKAVLEGRFHRP